MKYWNARRIQRARERKRGSEERRFELARIRAERERTYQLGNHRKNMELMLDALGSKIRRRMVERLKRGGAMSLSKLVDPLDLMLPAALEQLRILERAGIVSTHKRGRIRICVYRSEALKELAGTLASTGLKSN